MMTTMTLQAPTKEELLVKMEETKKEFSHVAFGEPRQIIENDNEFWVVMVNAIMENI